MTYTVANILTLSRFFIAPIFLVCILSGRPWGMDAAILLFLVGALTDYFDGLTARALNEESEIGQYLDPLADKVLTTSAWIAFWMVDVMPLWMVIVIIVRDFGTTVLRSIATSREHHFHTSRSAKWKTFVQMCFIVYALALLWLLHSSFINIDRDSVRALLYSPSTYGVILAITLFTLYTFFEYVVVNRRLFRRG